MYERPSLPFASSPRRLSSAWLATFAVGLGSTFVGGCDLSEDELGLEDGPALEDELDDGLELGPIDGLESNEAPALTGSFDPPTRWNYDYSIGDGWIASDHPRMLADVTGEGRADLIGFHEDGVWVSKSSGSTFRPKRKWLDGAFGHGLAGGGWDVANHPRFLVDIDGDDQADIVGFGESGVWVSRAKPTKDGFTAPHFAGAYFGAGAAAGGWDPSRHIRDVRDIDDDGHVEIIGFGEEGVYVATLGPTPGGEYSLLAPPTQWLAGLGAAPTGGGWVVGTHPRMLGDVNGDGRQDVVGFGQSAVIVAYNEFTQFTPAWGYGYDFSAADHFTAAYWWTASHPRVLADINGDGRDDIVGFGGAGVIASLSGGSYFEPPQLWSPAYVSHAPYFVADGRVADVDGDGRADLLGFGLWGIFVSLSDAVLNNSPTTILGFPPLWSTFFATPSGAFPSEHVRLLGDVTGDGLVDLVQIDDSQVNVLVND
ncbi:MAG: VCBS repeat-containing protein [Nannocystaceae bacterium]